MKKIGLFFSFILTTLFCNAQNVIMQEKHIVPGVPVKRLYKLDITFYMGDGFAGAAFSSYNTSVTGVGESETKAYMNALRNININNPAYRSFIEQGKGHIIAYYNSQCDRIIREAQTYADMQQYSEALRVLSAVLNVCTACWNKCMDAAISIFQQKIDFDCKSLINSAVNVWNAGQNYDAAEQAGRILSKINPHSRRFGDALALSEKIGKRVREINQREWTFRYGKEIGLQQSLINAYRDVSIEWAKNQPQQIVYKSFW
jgi:tetratricopeptide (TPR) repeat protein